MSETSIEDLLKIISEEESKIPQAVSELEKFIEDFNIVEHKYGKVPTYVIYYTYKSVFKGELSKIEFFRNFKKKFKQRRLGSQRRYAVKGDFDLSEEGLIRAEYFEKGLK